MNRDCLEGAQLMRLITATPRELVEEHAPDLSFLEKALTTFFLIWLKHSPIQKFFR